MAATIRSLLRDTLDNIRETGGVMVRAATVPAAIYFLIDLGGRYLLGDVGGLDSPAFWGSMGLSLAGVVLVSLFAVACHRRALLGPSEPAVVRLGWREVRFLIVMVLIFLLVFLAMLSVQYVGRPLLLNLGLNGPLFSAALGFMLGMFLFLRFCLALPAAAMDAPGGPRGAMGLSWTLTRGRFWMLLGAFLAVWLPMMAMMALPLGLIQASGLASRHSATQYSGSGGGGGRVAAMLRQKGSLPIL